MHQYSVLIFFLFSFLSLEAQTDLSGVINDYTVVTAIDADDCMTQLSVTDATFFAVGDQVVIIQMQGAQMDESNSNSFGNITDIGGAGQYEINEVASIDGQNIFLKFQLTNDYTVAGKVQLIRMPVYQDVEVMNTLTASAWDGNTGGVLALQVDGQLLMGGNIDVSGLGFRGGIAQTAATNDCTWLIQQDDYFYALDNWRGSTKGEGIVQAILNKESGKGPQANGGGGGNDHNSGGAGGAQITNGGAGGKNNEPSTFGCKGNHPGIGGKGIATIDNRLFLGGGGGAGHENNDIATDGGNGGGIVILIVNEFIPVGFSIVSDGNSPEDGGGDGAGGGGAGGTILLDIQNIESTVHLDARGGDGGLTDNNNINRCHGPGGGGSGGRIITNLVVGDPFSTTLNGGDAGLSINSSSCSDDTNEAEDGEAGVLELLNATVVATTEFLLPTADFTTVLNGGNLELNNESTSGDTYLWEFGDMNTSMLFDPSHVYMESGVFTIQLIAINDCGSDTLTQEVTVVLEAAPTAAFTFNVMSGCAPLTVDFSNASLGMIDEYSWTFDGGTPQTASIADPQVVYTTPGVYSVQLMVTGTGGTDVLIEENIIEVLSSPVADFNTSINGGAVNFSNTSSNANSSQWNFGDNATATSMNPNHTYSESGTYDVQLIAGNGFCSDTTTQTIVVELPTTLTAAFSLDDGNGCAPWTVNFSDGSLGTVDTYLWTFEGGDPATSTTENPEVVYTTPGIYNVQLEVTGPNGSDLVLVESLIEIVPAVETSFGYDINELEVDFTNVSANATSYQWNFGDGSPVSTEENPIHEYAVGGTYEVTLIATSDWCGMSVTETVFLDFVDVINLEAIDAIEVFPNPVHDVLTISTKLEGALVVNVFTFDGKELPEFAQEFSGNTKLNVQDLARGIYLLVINNGQQISRYRMVKM